MADKQDQTEPLPPPPKPGEIVHPEGSQQAKEPTQPAAAPVSSGSWMKRLGIGISVVVAVALVVVAAILAKKLIKPPPPKAPTASKKDIQLIRYGILEGPVNSFYPNVDASNTSFHINDQIYEGLVQFQGVTQVVPQLAESWSNPDQNTWVFKLRQNVKFHDGNAMTSKDVKFSLDKFKDTAFGGEFGSTIKSVDTNGDYEVKITTSGPDPILLHRLAYLYIVDSTASSVGPADGTGPYQVKLGTTPSDNSLDLVAFDGYHGGHIYTHEVQVTAFEKEADLAQAIQDKKIDLADYILGSDTINQLKKAGITVVAQRSQQVNFIGFNVNRKGAPAQKLAFRQAVLAAIDVNQVIQAAGLNGEVEDQFVTKDIPGYNPAIKLARPDVAKAKSLLASAGYPKGTTITLSRSVDDPVFKNIQTQLAAVGIKVVDDHQPGFGGLIDKVLGGKADTWFLGYSSDLVDASDTFANLFQGKPYDNSQVDSSLTQANQTLDDAKRLALLQQAAQTLSDDVAAVPLYTRTEYYATSQPYVITADRASTPGYRFWKVYLP